MNAKVSIIIPVFNGEKTISRAIQSCIDQTYENIEIIVIDNQSTDRTKQKVTFFSDPRIRYLYLEKKGRSLARNAGLKVASGNYLQFLDADDTLKATKIAEAVECLEEHSAIFAYCHGIDYQTTDGQVVKSVFPNYQYENELLGHNVFPIHSLLFRRQKTIFFQEGLDYCEDWLFWVQTLTNEAIFFDKKRLGGTVLISGNNTMSQTTAMSEYELYIQQELKKKYKFRSIQLKKNEVIRLIIHYFNPEKKAFTKDAIQKHSKITYKLVECLCKIPGIKQFLQKKIKQIQTADVYYKGET